MNICESLTVAARWYPENIAIIFGNRRLTYAELDSLSFSAGECLLNAGVQRGDRVALMLPNAPSFPVWYYAALRIGAIAVSVSTRLAASEVAFVLDDCKASAFVAVDDDLAALAEPIPSCVTAVLATSILGDSCDGQPFSTDAESDRPWVDTDRPWVDTDRDEAAVILYTSGTTGFAKGATLSHGNVRSNVFAFNHLCNMRPQDRILLAVPLFHCFGQNALLNSGLNVGATLVLQQKFDLNEAKRLIAEHQVTQLYGVPMMFQLLHESSEPSGTGVRQLLLFCRGDVAHSNQSRLAAEIWNADPRRLRIDRDVAVCQLQPSRQIHSRFHWDADRSSRDENCRRRIRP